MTESMFTDWAPGHPNADPHNTEDCVLISLTENFLWKDAPCYERTQAAPICQRDLELNVTTTTTQTEAPSTTTSYSSQLILIFMLCAKLWVQVLMSLFLDHVELRGGDGYSSGNVFAVNIDGILGPVCTA